MPKPETKSETNPPSRPTIRTASGQTPVPAVVEEKAKFDESNPANAPRIRPARHRDPEVERLNQELHELLALDTDDEEVADRMHALHYLVAGLPVPGADSHPGVDQASDVKE